MLRTAVRPSSAASSSRSATAQLAALQFGLISTMMKTLALRDHMTARHSAAVARYAREMARSSGFR